MHLGRLKPLKPIYLTAYPSLEIAGRARHIARDYRKTATSDMRHMVLSCEARRAGTVKAT